MTVIHVIAAFILLVAASWFIERITRSSKLAIKLENDQTITLPDKMIALRSRPVGADGAPEWTQEIESATARFGPTFRAAAMHETVPGQTLCILLARASYSTEVRTYIGRAILIQRRDDSFRAKVYITAPAVTTALYDYPTYSYEYVGPTSKEDAKDVPSIIRLLCERSHTELVAKMVSNQPLERDPTKEMQDRLEESATLFATPYDPELWKIAEARKGTVSLKAVSDEYDRLVLERHRLS